MRKIKVEEHQIDEVNIEVTECCGVEYLYRLQQDPNAVIAAARDHSVRRAMITFNDKVNRGYGKKLADKIRSQKLGTLTAGKKVLNRNSGNIIQMWIWYPDWVNVDKYVKRFDYV